MMRKVLCGILLFCLMDGVHSQRVSQMDSLTLELRFSFVPFAILLYCLPLFLHYVTISRLLSLGVC